MERDRGQLMDSGVIATLEADAGNLRVELQRVADDLSEIGPVAEQLSQDELDFGSERDNTLQTIDTVTSSGSAASAAAEVRGELRSLRSGAERADGELHRLQVRFESLIERLERLDEDAERLRLECSDAQSIEATLVAELESAEARRTAAERARESASRARQTAADDVARWGTRAEALHLALEGARARAGAAHLAGIDDVLGTLLDLIEIDSGWESAVEAALVEALEAVVVASPHAGRRALDSLRGSNVHGADRTGTTRLRLWLPARIAVRPHVRSGQAGVSELLDAIVGSAVRVPTWPEAIDLAIAHPQAVVVTEDGDRFGPTGWRVGATSGGATASALEEAQERLGIATAELENRTRTDDIARAELLAAQQREAEVVDNSTPTTPASPQADRSGAHAGRATTSRWRSSLGTRLGDAPSDWNWSGLGSPSPSARSRTDAGEVPRPKARRPGEARPARREAPQLASRRQT
jgi:chromosome segregation protein